MLLIKPGFALVETEHLRSNVLRVGTSFLSGVSGTYGSCQRCPQNCLPIIVDIGPQFRSAGRSTSRGLSVWRVFFWGDKISAAWTGWLCGTAGRTTRARIAGD